MPISDTDLTARPLLAGRSIPMVIEAPGNRDLPIAAVAELRDDIDRCLTDAGAVLFRGFAVPDVEHFQAFLDQAGFVPLDYVYRSTPRDTVANRIYTATQYPKDQAIPLHCENAYQREWPLRLAFYCATPAQGGGETPLADMRRVTSLIGDDRLGRFKAKGVRYVRNYGKGVDLPWETVFQTDRRGDVEDYCTRHGLAFEWTGPKSLRTHQVCQGTAIHPSTQHELFFNQAHLFHVSSLGTEMADGMVRLFGSDGLPRNAFYGDGTEFDLDDLSAIRQAFDAESVVFPWQKNDVLLVDNMLVAHGRRPFTGNRQVLVSMSDPYSADVSAK